MYGLPQTFGSRNDKPRINEIATSSTNSRNDSSTFAMTALFSSLQGVKLRNNSQTTNSKHKNRKEKEFIIVY